MTKRDTCRIPPAPKFDPTASTPLTWEEVEAIACGEGPARQYDAVEVLRRVEQHGDLLAPLCSPGPQLPRG